MTTPKELAKELGRKLGWHPNDASVVAWTIESYGRAEYARAIEDAATLCLEDAKGYEWLQTSARNDNDKEAALSHLCEKTACRDLAVRIRALKEKP